ncbi:helix-turn-helix domain-containing protein [Dolosigranulum pigrum]|uniref:helix-turn-helix domain-containing protein n=1 Tax=Dolosigranulum pigrum TaxID=29394 RepID=UPI001AD89F30|nr:XRE family transcriptional regulator [Dolosigranulum pigrum]QTJ50516.1 helix-turn-helix domain-containing protein [Dolosigranulum pigrum]
MNLKERRLELGLTLEEVGDIVGVGKSTVRKWEQGMISNMGRDKIVSISKALKISPLDILEIEEQNNIYTIYNQLNPTRQTKVYNFATDQLNEQRVEETPAIYHTVQVYSLLSAGTGIVDLDPTDTTEIELNGHVPPHDLAFEVRGDSMEPVFENGEIVFVKKTQDIHNGQIIAVQINEEAFIKKVYITNDHMRLVSLNKEYEDIIANEQDDIRIVGKVLI